MLFDIDNLAFLLGKSTPKYEDDILALVGECANRRISEFLPPLLLVGASIVRANGECRIEEQNTLLGPPFEVPLPLYRSSEIRLDLSVYILKRWRQCNAFAYRKTETIGLPAAMIGVLA